MEEAMLQPPSVTPPLQQNPGIPTRVVTTTKQNGEPSATVETSVTQLSLASETVTNSTTFILVALICFALSYLAFAGILVWRVAYLTIYATPANIMMLSATLDTIKQIGTVSTVVLGTVILGKDLASKLQGIFLK